MERARKIDPMEWYTIQAVSADGQPWIAVQFLANTGVLGVLAQTFRLEGGGRITITRSS